jgi:hypothetical protein
MYLLLTDETNRNPTNAAKFFIYGGVFFPYAAIDSLDAAIRQIRAETGYRAGDQLKFDTHCRPTHVSQEQATRAKNRVLEAAVAHGVKFIVYMILHDIIKNKNPHEQLTWAADHVFGRFNDFLVQETTFGICIVDNLPTDREFQYLSDKHQVGLQLVGGAVRPLDRIKLFASTTCNAGNVNSVMDIVLGGFRYCVNSNTESQLEASRSIMAHLKNLIWKRNGRFIKSGLIVRPMEIRSQPYQVEYANALQKLKALLDPEVEQPA